jgi:hypothetical protein
MRGADGAKRDGGDAPRASCRGLWVSLLRWVAPGLDPGWTLVSGRFGRRLGRHPVLGARHARRLGLRAGTRRGHAGKFEANRLACTACSGTCGSGSRTEGTPPRRKHGFPGGLPFAGFCCPSWGQEHARTWNRFPAGPAQRRCGLDRRSRGGTAIVVRVVPMARTVTIGQHAQSRRERPAPSCHSRQPREPIRCRQQTPSRF